MAVVSAAGSSVIRLESTFLVLAGAAATVAAKQQTYSSTNDFVRWVVMAKRDQLIACVQVRETDDVTHVNTSVRWRLEVKVQPLAGNAH